MRYLFPFDKVEKGSNIILYGMGKVGKSFKEQIDHTQYCNIICMCDKKPTDGILSPDSIVNYANNVDKIILSVQSEILQNEMRQLCIELGLDEEKIVTGDYDTINANTLNLADTYGDYICGVYYAQYAEDSIVKNIFDIIGVKAPGYLDIGCNNPVCWNNTFLFYKKFMGSGVLVDANPALIDLCKKVRPKDLCLCFGISDIAGQTSFYISSQDDSLSSLNYEQTQYALEYFSVKSEINRIDCTVITLQQLLDSYCGGSVPELFSLDVEGHEMKVLNSANAKAFDENTVSIIERSGLSQEIYEFFTTKGYFLYMNTPGNHIFVKTKYRDLLLAV